MYEPTVKPLKFQLLWVSRIGTHQPETDADSLIRYRWQGATYPIQFYVTLRFRLRATPCVGGAPAGPAWRASQTQGRLDSDSCLFWAFCFHRVTCLNYQCELWFNSSGLSAVVCDLIVISCLHVVLIRPSCIVLYWNFNSWSISCWIKRFTLES